MPNYKSSDLAAAAALRSDYDYTDKANWLKLEVGKKGFKSNLLFICPPHVNMKTWFEPSWVHFLSVAGGKTRTIGCARRMFGEDHECPVDEVAGHLFESKGKEAARPFWPKPSYMLNVFKVEPDGTITDTVPYVLGCGNELFGLIWDEFNPDDTGQLTRDITDVAKGFIINIKAHESEKRFRGKAVAEYKVQVVGAANGFPGDLELLDTLNDLSQFTQYLKPEEVVALLTGGANADPWASESEQLTSGAPIEAEYREVEEEAAPTKTVLIDPEEEETEDPRQPAEPLAANEAEAIEAGVKAVAERAVKKNSSVPPSSKGPGAATTPPPPAPVETNSTAADLKNFLAERAKRK